jgi:DNA-binding NarL/FixJ family response regulator
VEAANRLLRNMARKTEPSHLTERQSRIVELIACGWSDGEIALELGIDATTVREHVSGAKRRLGARSRPHAVALWLMEAA